MSDKQPSLSPRLGQWMALANLMTAGASLLFASLLLILFQFFSLRDALVEDVRVQAKIIGDSSTAALAFSDPHASEEMLSALDASPNIQAAAIFTAENKKPLALYTRKNMTPITASPRMLSHTSHRFGLNYLEVVQPIKLDGRQLGFVAIRAGLERLYMRILGYTGTTLAIALGAFGMAYLLVSRMRRLVQNAEAHLDYLAHIDSITGLPNRHTFNERLAYALAKVDQFGGSVGLLLLDLDNFKVVNDTLGHHNGDKLLKQVAQRLVEAVRSADAICRIGGDEFVIILESRNTVNDAQWVASRILDALVAPFALDVHEFYVTASVGISLYPQDAQDLQTLTRNADTAMYQAKSKGKNAYEKFHPEMDRRAQKRLLLEINLRKAIEREELILYYQPQVSLKERRIIGVEALLRWNHPELGVVNPIDFIPVAEESGLIIPIGSWVLRTACEQAAAWRDAGLGLINMSVNLSVRQTKHAELMGEIRSALRHVGLPPSQLELEITETVLMENVHENVDLLNRLQTEGIRLSIDDFGTGYSSMAYLKRFPINQVKIDRTFVRDIPENADDKAIAVAIVVMAHSLGLSVVAEGVETEQQLQFLHDIGCDIIQGFYFSAPLSATRMTQLLQQGSAAFDKHWADSSTASIIKEAL